MTLLIAGLAIFTSFGVQGQEDDNEIFIGVVDGQLLYNVTDITLERTIQYTIIFENIDVVTGHNLRIDVNQNLEDGGDIADSDDILIGVENDDGEGVGLNSWSGTWTTPDEDTEVIYYCGFSGHYVVGMEGVFVIGESENGGIPGMTSYMTFTALFVGTAVATRHRKR